MREALLALGKEIARAGKEECEDEDEKLAWTP